MKNIIITGGAGFIGSHVVRLFVNKYSEYRIINMDVLTYAGNLENLSDIEDAPNYVFDACGYRRRCSRGCACLTNTSRKG
jgi:dTDP-glucose 4,6-dehydratase